MDGRHRVDRLARYKPSGATIAFAVVVIGRRLFNLPDGWTAGRPHVRVVTHEPAKDCKHADTAPFTFVAGVDAAISTAPEYAGDRVVDVAAGEIGGQALRLSHRPGRRQSRPRGVRRAPSVPRDRPAARPILFGNPSRVVQGDHVTRLVYDVAKG